MGTRILTIYLLFILSSCCKEESTNNTKKFNCKIVGYEKTDLIWKQVEIGENKIGLYINSKIGSSWIGTNFYSKNGDTVNMMVGGGNIVYRYIYQYDSSKIIKFRPSTPSQRYSHIFIRDNRIERIVQINTGLFESETLKVGDTANYIYNSSKGISQAIIKNKSNQIKSNFKLDYNYDYPIYDFSQEIDILSYLYKLDYKNFILKTQIKNDTTLDYKIQLHTTFNFPNKIKAGKDSIFYNLECE